MKKFVVFVCFQMEKKDFKLPTVEFVKKKAHELDHSKNITLKEEDIDQVS